MNLLECSNVETLVSETTNAKYVRALFRPVEFHGDRSIFTSGNSGARIFNVGKEPKAGEIFQGSLVKMDTTPYKIKGTNGGTDREVTSITVVAFADDNAQE